MGMERKSYFGKIPSAVKSIYAKPFQSSIVLPAQKVLWLLIFGWA